MLYNTEVAEVLRKTYGDENFKIYCEMQVTRNKLINEELSRLNGEPDDTDYEAYFWQTKLDELLNQPNH